MKMESGKGAWSSDLKLQIEKVKKLLSCRHWQQEQNEKQEGWGGGGDEKTREKEEEKKAVAE